VVENRETTAAGEAWQHGSFSSQSPAPRVVENRETTAAGEAWQHGIR
jgi:hypothetical protein